MKRMDNIITDMKNIIKCIDNSCLFSNILEGCFWQTLG